MGVAGGKKQRKDGVHHPSAHRNRNQRLERTKQTSSTLEGTRPGSKDEQSGRILRPGTQPVDEDGRGDLGLARGQELCNENPSLATSGQEETILQS